MIHAAFIAIQSNFWLLFAFVGPAKYRDVFGVLACTGSVVSIWLFWRATRS